VQKYLALEGQQLDQDTYFSYFAYCLLSGQVVNLPTKSLLFSADRVLGGDLTQKVSKLINSLRSNQVSNVSQLKTVWETSDPEFLRAEL